MYPANSIKQIKDYLQPRRQTVSIAESVTSGLLQHAFSTAPEAMDIFQGGMTVYNIGQKCRYFNIDPIHAVNCHCVSEKIAADLASGICKLFTSDWGIGITGFATPVPESDQKTYACFCIAKGREIKICTTVYTDQQAQQAQLFYTNNILDEFAALLAAG